MQPPASVQATAAGVAYFTVPGADLRMFRCEDQDATLSTKGCAARHVAALKPPKPGDRGSTDACRPCPIGATHAGLKVIHEAPAFASDRCPRCGYGTTRMIGNRLCVGCYNREREVLRGVNGRGNLPGRTAPVVHQALRYAIDGELMPLERRTVAVQHTAKVRTGNRDRKGKPIYTTHTRGGALEAAFQLLRTTQGRVDLAVTVCPPPIACQGSLFA